MPPPVSREFSCRMRRAGRPGELSVSTIPDASPRSGRYEAAPFIWSFGCMDLTRHVAITVRDDGSDGRWKRPVPADSLALSYYPCLPLSQVHWALGRAAAQGDTGSYSPGAGRSDGMCAF